MVLVLLLANFVDLTAIASLGSAMALAIFLVVSIAAFRLRKETASNTAVLVAAIVLTVVVLLVFAIQSLRTEPETFIAIIGILLLAVLLGLVWTRLRQRRTGASTGRPTESPRRPGSPSGREGACDILPAVHAEPSVRNVWLFSRRFPEITSPRAPGL